jgi:cytochrome c oxidase subunit 4
MTDEEKNTLTGQRSGDPIKPTPEYTEGEAERMPEPETVVEEAVQDVVEVTEEAADTSLIEGYDEALQTVMETAAEVVDDPIEHHAGELSDTVALLGREITLPGGIYTVVFIALGVITLVEILLAEIPRGFLTIPLMLSLAAAKAILVVMYYMHLKEDSRVFTLTLLLPLGVALVATLFLLAVPVTGY